VKNKILLIAFFVFSVSLSSKVNKNSTTLSLALSLLGMPYDYSDKTQPYNDDTDFGGDGIMNYSFTKIDCSGHVCYAAGLRRHYYVSDGTLAKFLNSVSWDNLQPGDLLMSSGHIMVFEKFDKNPALVWYVSASSASKNKKVVEARGWKSELSKEFSPYRFNTEENAPTITISGVEDGETYTKPVALSFTAKDDLSPPKLHKYVPD
jgi:hypothetical protein